MVKNNKAEVLQFDITSLARSWYDTGKNYGIELRSINESLRAEAYFITSDNNFGEETHPAAYFYYRNTAGLEDYWSYHSVDAGRAGTGYVNDFNGNLVFIHEDVSTIGNVMPVTISHVYNLCDKDKNLAYGNGWRLNVQQRLETTGMSDYPYVYTDGDGTKHYFYKDKDDGSKLKDEDGLGLTITQESPSNASETIVYRIITCKDKSKMVFDKQGYLRQSIDTNGNMISYGYTGDKLTSVTDGNGKVLTLSYSASTGRLEYIQEDETGRKTTFTYDGRGNLSAITHPDGVVTNYTYDDGKLIRGEWPEVCGAGFEYKPDFKVQRVSAARELGSTGQAGGSVKLLYDNGNTTRFQYPGLDGEYGTSDDLYYYYDFDNCGRTLTVRDTEGMASSYRYYTDGNINNRLKEEGTLKKTVHNYVGNPGFDSGSSLADDRWGTLATGTTAGYSAAKVSSAGYEGGTSMCIQKPDSTEGRVAAAQTISGLKAGTYTLSAYMKTEDVAVHAENADYGAALGINYLNGTHNGTTLVSEETLTGTSDTAIEDGWKQISLTFEIPENNTNIQIWGGLNYASGRIWCASVQLEEGGAYEGYNFVNNPGFEYGSQSGTAANVWSLQNPGSGDGRVAGEKWAGTYALRLAGAPESKRTVSQTINASGNEGDVYSLSGWAKANAIPGKEFRIGAKIYYSNGSSVERDFDFDPYLTGWQYAGGMLSTDDQKDMTSLQYTKIEVFLEYSNQCNTAWFDGIQLTKDEGVTYVYDTEGNLVSTKDAAEKDSFQSDKNGNLTNLVSPTGSSYTYAYDTEQNLIWARALREYPTVSLMMSTAIP